MTEETRRQLCNILRIYLYHDAPRPRSDAWIQRRAIYTDIAELLEALQAKVSTLEQALRTLPDRVLAKFQNHPAGQTIKQTIADELADIRRETALSGESRQ